VHAGVTVIPMTRLAFLSLCLFLSFPAVSLAEEVPTEELTEEQWLKALRASGSYRHGMEVVDKYISAAFDFGAIAGATHWEDIHDYYIQLARAKGCQKGKAYASGPVEACHRMSGSEPKVIGKDYERGKKRALALAEQTLYPGSVSRVLVVLYDYGYVQGMKHGLRVHNDDIRLAQTYYRSCMARANDAKGAEPCAESSKTWSEKLLERLRARIEAHGLPARSQPE
jgi:hypothetical protein